jgi:hypothetical protein
MALYVDDNNRTIAFPQGLRPTAGTSGIISATMSASTQELLLPTGTSNVHGEYIYRLIGNGQAVFYALDKAGQGASYTGVTNMVFVPSNVVEYFKTNITDVKIYILQGAAAGVVQIVLMQ